MNFSSKASTVSLSTRTNAFAVAALLALLVGLSGCTGKAGTAGPAGPAGTATAQQPLGTIQGRLRDSVTQQPIVGAVVDIGVSTATTNADGQFVISNVVVPIDALNQIKATDYKVTVDMRAVTSPVNMASATATPRYPDFSYDIIAIDFTAVTATTTPVTTSPVNELVATKDINVGKLAATINGVVGDATTLQNVGAGYTVNLYSNNSSNSATGNGTGVNAGNLVATTTTVAGGTFTFANIESGQTFTIVATNAAQTMAGSIVQTAPADGQTLTESLLGTAVLGNNPVLVSSTDNVAPTIISVTPANNTDFSPVGGTSVVFTFSEPIQQSGATDVSPSNPNGFYSKVAVNYNGAKASNIAHSLSWNATFDQLTVTIPTLAASSKYSVDISTTGLVDTNNLAVTNLAAVGAGIINFTTNGSTSPAAPVIALGNAGLNNLTGATPVLNWLPVSGANKGYYVYMTTTVGGLAGASQLQTATPILATSYAVALPTATPFSNGQIPITYSYTVTSVGADYQESAVSNTLLAADTVAPTVVAIGAIVNNTAAPYTTTVTFSEPADEASATNVSNYTNSATAGTAASITSAVLDTTNTIVTLTLTPSATTPAANGTQTLTVTTGVKDIAGNALAAAVASAVY